MTCSGCSGAVSRVLNKAKDTGGKLNNISQYQGSSSLFVSLDVSDYSVLLDTQEVLVTSRLPYDDILAKIQKTGKECDALIRNSTKTSTFILISALRRLSVSRCINGRLKMSTASNIVVPDGFTLHTENTSHILLESNKAFLNPVQEFNRDTSVACIRVWSEELNKSKEERWRQHQEKRAKKQKGGVAKKRKEALSATGLRSIRYAKEIPLLKHVIANDLSPSATAAMRRNIEINDLGSAHDASGKVRINEGDAW
ncbi:hypothetical protein C0989_008727 [Termitomyces sp. Mn162]|nr:hypothetical protein C0989_008727 [Termitomyces sp. Mn162]